MRRFFRRLKRIWNSDEKIPDDIRVVVDLDRLGSEPVGFRFGGRVHKIVFIDTETFLDVVNDLGNLDNLSKKVPVPYQLLAAGYAQLITTVCSTISKSDVYGMSVPQRAALMQQIIKIVSGDAFADSQKKNPEIPEASAS
jgi:hypothetical protein